MIKTKDTYISASIHEQFKRDSSNINRLVPGHFPEKTPINITNNNNKNNDDLNPKNLHKTRPTHKNTTSLHIKKILAEKDIDLDRLLPKKSIDGKQKCVISNNGLLQTNQEKQQQTHHKEKNELNRKIDIKQKKRTQILENIEELWQTQFENSRNIIEKFMIKLQTKVILTRIKKLEHETYQHNIMNKRNTFSFGTRASFGAEGSKGKSGIEKQILAQQEARFRGISAPKESIYTGDKINSIKGTLSYGSNQISKSPNLSPMRSKVLSIKDLGLTAKKKLLSKNTNCLSNSNFMLVDSFCNKLGGERNLISANCSNQKSYIKQQTVPNNRIFTGRLLTTTNETTEDIGSNEDFCSIKDMTVHDNINSFPQKTQTSPRKVRFHENNIDKLGNSPQKSGKKRIPSSNNFHSKIYISCHSSTNFAEKLHYFYTSISDLKDELNELKTIDILNYWKHISIRKKDDFKKITSPTLLRKKYQQKNDQMTQIDILLQNDMKQLTVIDLKNKKLKTEYNIFVEREKLKMKPLAQEQVEEDIRAYLMKKVDPYLFEVFLRDRFSDQDLKGLMENTRDCYDRAVDQIIEDKKNKKDQIEANKKNIIEFGLRAASQLSTKNKKNVIISTRNLDRVTNGQVRKKRSSSLSDNVIPQNSRNVFISENIDGKLPTKKIMLSKDTLQSSNEDAYGLANHRNIITQRKVYYENKFGCKSKKPKIVIDNFEEASKPEIPNDRSNSCNTITKDKAMSQNGDSQNITGNFESKSLNHKRHYSLKTQSNSNLIKASSSQNRHQGVQKTLYPNSDLPGYRTECRNDQVKFVDDLVETELNCFDDGSMQSITELRLNRCYNMSTIITSKLKQGEEILPYSKFKDISKILRQNFKSLKSNCYKMNKKFLNKYA